MNQRSEDPNRNIDIGNKAETNQSEILNPEGSLNFEDPNILSRRIGETKDTVCVTDKGGSNDRSQGGYLQSNIFEKERDQGLNHPEKKENKSGRSLS